MSALDRLKQI
jgi:hypothetical protein